MGFSLAAQSSTGISGGAQAALCYAKVAMAYNAYHQASAVRQVRTIVTSFM